MKTTKQLLTTIVVLLCSVMAHAGDFEFQADGIYYYITSNENLTIGVTYKGGSYDDYSNEYSGKIVIPEKVIYMEKTYTVTSIYSDAFRECNNLTSVTIPNSVTTIGSTAFLGCDSLSSITIPNSVTTIGSSAFMSCKSLSSVTIGNSVTKINLNTFAHCPSLTSVTIGNSVTYIDNSAFSYCSSLTSINISDLTAWCNIDLKGPSTPFDYAKNLYLNGEIVTNLIIPEGVDSIKNCIFEGFESITSVSISNSVNYIGERAFYGCKYLSSITIPNSVTTIGNEAFSYCTSLTSITIPNSVTSIGNYAFNYCSSLTSITILNSVTSIGNYAFNYCSSLTSITIPNSVTSIGNSAFRYCTSLTSISIPNSVTSIGDGAFYECISLASITIPNSVNFIGYQAFKNCNILISITIKATTPPTLNRSLDYNGIIYIPDNTLSAYKEAWGDEYNFVCNENSLTIHIETPGTLSDKIFEAWQRPANVAKLTLTGTLNDNDFTLMRETMTSLTEVDLSGITNTSGVNFKKKDNLVTICLPKNLSKIDHEAFYDCKHLYYVSMSNNITSIETSAFKNCYSLLSITIPNSVISIGRGAFEKCLALSAVHISDIAAWCNIKFDPWNSNPLYYAHNLYLNNAKVTDLVIPEGVDSIKDYAFNDCLSLTSVTIENSVTSIGDEAFSGCYNLKSATIGDCVTSIADGAFHRCSSLTSITIPSSVTSIGNSAFSYCSFTSITIPSSVTSIGDYAFACDSLSLITCLRITPPYANDLGANTKKCTLMVPKEAYAEYLKHEYWGQFLTIKPLDSNIYKKIDISVNDSSFGNINIVNGYYCINDSITITATPNKGFHFTQWSDGNTENPRTIVITQDTTFTAEFAIDSFYISGISSNGTIEGTGRYAYNTEVYINAIPNKGYHFIQWLDGNTDNPRNIVVTQDSTFTAQFAINTYNVTLSVENGSAIGGGEYNHGEKATLTASPNEGYHFTQWSDGNTNNPRIVIVTQDSTFTAEFEINTYNITLSAENGSIIGEDKYNHGEKATLTASPNEGYHFTQWSDGNTNNPRIVIVTQDSTFTAIFEANSFSISTDVNDDAMGSVTEGGEYTYGTEITLTAIANEGYFFVKWSDEITDNPRTVIVTEDKTYIAEFRVASTSVENTTNSNISIFTTGNTLHIESATTDYYILDAAGRLIYTGNGNTTTLTLPRGIYLITIGGEVEKIVL